MPEPFKSLTSKCLVLSQANIDTDTAIGTQARRHRQSRFVSSTHRLVVVNTPSPQTAQLNPDRAGLSADTMDKLKSGAFRVTGLFKRNDDGLHSVLQKRSTRSGRSTRSDPFVDGPQMEEVS